MPGSPTATAPGAIAGGKVTANDAAKHSLTVQANGTTTVLDIYKAAVAGTIVVGKLVDVTYAGTMASAVSVRP